MIACIIEFGVKDGRDQDRKRLLAESIRLNSTSCPLDAQCGAHPRNRAGEAGNLQPLQHQIATIERKTHWTAPAEVAAG